MRKREILKADKMRHDQKKGFTLLELLISMTIISIIVVIVFGAFRIGVRAWEKGEKDVQIHQRLRIGLDRVKAQLASVCTRKIMDAGKQQFFLKGDDKNIEFISLVSMMPGNGYGMVYAKYKVEYDYETETERFLFYEKNIVLPDREAGSSSPDDDEFHEIISGMQSITFEYLQASTGGYNVNEEQEWNSGVHSGFPKAIGIVVKKDDKTVPVRVIATVEQGE